MCVNASIEADAYVNASGRWYSSNPSFIIKKLKHTQIVINIYFTILFVVFLAD
jgi:hypothetical protein